mmetsp:Transcript_34221/g.99355  ORF Transcript_34221/g.99355 Transcript_34221/m.99355 type:complete len:279 (-) Transcript_34221:1063-1899(-)
MLLDLEEQRLLGQVRHVDLMVQVHLENVRQIPEQVDVAPHEPALLGDALLEVAPDAGGELHGDIVLAHVTPQLRELRLLLPSDLSEVRHRLRDGADEGRESDHPSDDNEDVVRALDGIPRHHLHGRRRQLRDGPMHGGRVSVGEAIRLIELGDPMLRRPHGFVVDVKLQRPDRVPQAGDQVVDDDDEGGQLGDLEQCQQVFRADSFKQLGEEAVQLDEAEQAGEAHKAEHPPRAKEHDRVAVARLLVQEDLEADEDPIDDDEAKVQAEPRLKIALRGL